MAIFNELVIVADSQAAVADAIRQGIRASDTLDERRTDSLLIVTRGSMALVYLLAWDAELGATKLRLWVDRAEHVDEAFDGRSIGESIKALNALNTPISEAQRAQIEQGALKHLLALGGETPEAFVPSSRTYQPLYDDSPRVEEDDLPRARQHPLNASAVKEESAPPPPKRKPEGGSSLVNQILISIIFGVLAVIVFAGVRALNNSGFDLSTIFARPVTPVTLTSENFTLTHPSNWGVVSPDRVPNCQSLDPALVACSVALERSGEAAIAIFEFVPTLSSRERRMLMNLDTLTELFSAQIEGSGYALNNGATLTINGNDALFFQTEYTTLNYYGEYYQISAGNRLYAIEVLYESLDDRAAFTDDARAIIDTIVFQ
jgi:hypothetical protein